MAARSTGHKKLYNMLFVQRNYSVRKNMDQNKWALGQNIAPGHLIYEGLQLT
jgi:hypothetical protein